MNNDRHSQLKRRVIRCLLFIVCSLNLSVYGYNDTDNLISELKREIKKKRQYDQDKEARIATIRKRLISADNEEIAARLEVQLLDEYLIYHRDSALVVAKRLVDHNIRMGNLHQTNHARLKLAHILVSAGLFKEASDCLNLVDIGNEQADLKYEYFHLLTWLYWAMQTTVDDVVYTPAYIEKEFQYRDSAIQYADPSAHQLELLGQFSDRARRNIDTDYDRYITFLNQLYKTDPKLAARLAYMYSDLYTDNRSTNLLLLAAIFDIRNSTKEAPAIIKVGSRLFQEGDIDHAYQFLQEAMDNASFFGSKLHILRISSLLSEVTLQKVLQTERKIWFSTSCAILLVLILAWVIYSRIRLKTLNEKVSFQHQKLQESYQSLKKSQLDNSWIMKVLAHDLRGTIAASLDVGAALAQNNQLGSDERTMLNLLKKSNQDALDTISDLLNLDAHRGSFQKTPFALDELAAETVKLLQYKAEEKHQRITALLTPITAAINREKMRRVLQNLLTNAIKFSPQNSEITLQVTGERPSYATIKIADNGIGIPREFHEHIFGLNPQVRREGTAGEPSFGLGLYICKQIVDEHGGTIRAEKNNGGGTVFILELPITPPEHH